MKLIVFSIVSDEARLNKRDAGFVDVIHTDGRARYKLNQWRARVSPGGFENRGDNGKGSPKQYFIVVVVDTFCTLPL